MKQVTIKTPFITLIVLDYGAIIQKLLVKDKDGRWTNMVVGLNFPGDYTKDDKFLGACIGRYAGRISNGGFKLDHTAYPLYHEKGVHLHGGKSGFAKKTWTIEEVDHGNKPFVKLSYLSKHLEEGYPGNLKVTVTYQLIENALHMTYEAITDRTTVVNLTNHSYFRLDDENKIDGYFLNLSCPHRVETLSNKLPTGNITSVANTHFDFLEEKEIGSIRLNTPMIIDPKATAVARVYSKKSGIAMEVSTNQRALVVYTPTDFPAICFEAQNYPDAPNFPNFPSSMLRPGEQYKNWASFTFDLI